MTLGHLRYSGRWHSAAATYQSDHRTDQPEPKVKLALTHEEIAHIIGTSRETVTRVLADFRKRQVAVLKGSTLTIRNKSVLEKLVGA